MSEPVEPADRGRIVVWAAVAVAMAIHIVLLFSDLELRGGADLKPHLRIIDEFRESPGLHNVYAPAYHVLGALIVPWLGAALYTRLFALAGAALLIAGFRSFQTAEKLPDAATALFALAPYTFALSWCIPKIEAAGYGMAFAGLALVLRRRYFAAALLLAATFGVHTASALFFGLAGGTLAWVRRDRLALGALAAGTVLAMPLFAAHLAEGCRIAESFLFSQGDYLRAAAATASTGRLATIAVLAGPIGIALAVFGLPRLWRGERGVAAVCAVAAFLYANEIWLAPFGMRTTLDLLRGLTVLAFPVAIAGGAWLGPRPRARLPVLAAMAVFAVLAARFTVPESCYVAPIDESTIRTLEVDRCTFRWRVDSRARPAPGSGG